MKAMILAAGLGKRMLPLTNEIPKPLVMINNRRLIEYTLEMLQQAGIKELVINLHHLGGKIQEYLNTGAKWGVNIAYSAEPELLDTGGAITAAIQRNLLGVEPFIVISADIITKFPLNTILNKLTKLAHLVLVPNSNLKPQGDFRIEHGHLMPPFQDPVLYPENYTYGNIGIFDPKIFTNTSFSTKFPLADLFHQNIITQQITAEVYTGEWHNIGSLQDLNHYITNHSC